MDEDMVFITVGLLFCFVMAMFVILIMPETRQMFRNSWYISKIKKEMRKTNRGVPDIPEFDDEKEG